MENSTSIWSERYRPKNFNEIIGQEKIVARIESFVKQKNIPHLLFSGPAGVGKTSLILVVAQELYGENWRENILETNEVLKNVFSILSSAKIPVRMLSLGASDINISIVTDPDFVSPAVNVLHDGVIFKDKERKVS